MKKIKLLGIFLAVIFAISFTGCGQTGNGTKKYLAKNIVFRDKAQMAQNQSQKEDESFSAGANANDEEVDDTTKIYADNVLFAHGANSSVESTNVQDAIEEISLILSKTMIGKWTIENKNIEEDNHSPTGKVTINENGTYDLTEGSFAAIGEGSGEKLCNHTPGTEIYTKITDDVLLFKHNNGSEFFSAIPMVISLKKNKIILIGSGSCGELGRQRVSILTRVNE